MAATSNADRRPAWWSATRLVRIAATAMIVLAGCAPTSTDSADGDPGAPPIVRPIPAIATDTWNRRGEVGQVSDLDALDSHLQDVAGEARRGVYSSVSGIDGAASEVSGAFFVPRGEAPEGGWPVVSFAHGTTGLSQDCGPSSSADLQGYAATVAGLLTAGFAVAATDYQGLGQPGIHPYLEPRTSAFNVIDAVRALRTLFPTVSSRWLAYGNSQGGQAAWAANEQNAFYGGGLDMVGAVALSPAANISSLAPHAFDMTLTPEQVVFMPFVITGIAAADPSFSPAPYLHGETEQYAGQLSGCSTESVELRARVLSAQDVKPTTQADTDVLSGKLRTIALPESRLGAPLLVMNGLADETILPSWVNGAVMRSCQLGGRIRHIEVKGAGHSTLSPDGEVAQWAVDRFADVPPPSDCPNG